MNVFAIGPEIPAGLGEPELTTQVLLARVGQSYEEAFRRSGYPYADEIAKLLAQARYPDPGGDPRNPKFNRDVRPELRQLKAISNRKGTDPWHLELSAALGICADLMLSGDVPVKNQ